MTYHIKALTYAKTNLDIIVNDVQSDLEELNIYPNHDNDI